MSTAIEHRVTDLESVMKELAYAQLRAERSIEELANEMKDFKDEMKDFKDEMKDFKDEMKDFKTEMRADRKDLNRKWGELANRLGTIVEDIVAPNIPGILSRYFGKDEPDILMIRIRKKHPSKPNLRREFDIIAVTENTLFLNETKATARRKYLEDFAENYKDVFDYFPEYAGLNLVPILSSLYLPPDAVEYLTSKGIYAMMMADESMDIVNFKEVSGKSHDAVAGQDNEEEVVKE